jgi:hypothetical protein
VNSLLGGKIQRIFADLTQLRGSGLRFCSEDQLVAAKFPNPLNREFSQDNSELIGVSGSAVFHVG